MVVPRLNWFYCCCWFWLGCQLVYCARFVGIRVELKLVKFSVIILFVMVLVKYLWMGRGY